MNKYYKKKKNLKSLNRDNYKKDISKNTYKIYSFSGKLSFLNNKELIVGFKLVDELGVEYSSVENAYQASKTNDLNKRIFISTLSPWDSVTVGKTILVDKKFTLKKEIIMYNFLVQKFSKEPYRSLLINTWNSFIEYKNNHGDNFWGTVDEYGQNKLGCLLMNVRDQLKRKKNIKVNIKEILDSVE